MTEANEPIQAHELVKLLMVEKGISDQELAEKMELSVMTVRQFIGNDRAGKEIVSKNPRMKTVKRYFKVIDNKKLIILDSEKHIFKHHEQILTIQELQRHLKKFYFRTSIGDFEITTGK